MDSLLKSKKLNKLNINKFLSYFEEAVDLNKFSKTQLESHLKTFIGADPIKLRKFTNFVNSIEGGQDVIDVPLVKDWSGDRAKTKFKINDDLDIVPPKRVSNLVPEERPKSLSSHERPSIEPTIVNSIPTRVSPKKFDFQKFSAQGIITKPEETSINQISNLIPEEAPTKKKFDLSKFTANQNLSRFPEKETKIAKTDELPKAADLLIDLLSNTKSESKKGVPSFEVEIKQEVPVKSNLTVEPLNRQIARSDKKIVGSSNFSLLSNKVNDLNIPISVRKNQSMIVFSPVFFQGAMVFGVIILGVGLFICRHLIPLTIPEMDLLPMERVTSFYQYVQTVTKGNFKQILGMISSTAEVIGSGASNVYVLLFGALLLFGFLKLRNYLNKKETINKIMNDIICRIENAEVLTESQIVKKYSEEAGVSELYFKNNYLPILKELRKTNRRIKETKEEKETERKWVLKENKN